MKPREIREEAIRVLRAWMDGEMKSPEANDTLADLGFPGIDMWKIDPDYVESLLADSHDQVGNDANRHEHA